MHGAQAGQAADDGLAHAEGFGRARQALREGSGRRRSCLMNERSLLPRAPIRTWGPP
jgi:hypothetical protein